MRELNNEDLIQMYRFMVLTRRFEETMAKLYHERKICELIHRSLGQEAIGVGATYGLRKDDLILPSLRTRAAFFVKGVPLNIMMAGVYGKKTGPSKGKESTHHMGDQELGIIGGSGVVGASIPVAVGAALGTMLKGTDRVTVVFFGDGATSRGDFHEGVNLAAVLSVPVIFVCENNQYALSTPQSKQMKIRDITDRAIGYGIPGVKTDGQDVLDVYNKVQEAVDRARQGLGPTFIECKTYRWAGHSELDTDWNMGRPLEEISYWRSKCPIKRFEELLYKRGILNAEIIKQIINRIDVELQEAIKFAEQSPNPTPEEALEDVYSG